MTKMRITPDFLHACVAETARILGCPEDTRGLEAPSYVPGTLRLGRDEAGYVLQLVLCEYGSRETLGYAMTARETDALLTGMRKSVTVAATLAAIRTDAHLANLQEGEA